VPWIVRGCSYVNARHRLPAGVKARAADWAGAVDDPAAARALYEQVIAVVEAGLGLSVERRPGFGLYSHADMAHLQNAVIECAALASAHLPPGHLVGAYIALGQRREIVVEAGLPCLLMAKVIAHEYAHAWLAEHGACLDDTELCEGFCEWVAWKVLGALGAADAQEILARGSGYYAGALRRVLEIEARGGGEAVPAAMRLRRSSPATVPGAACPAP
jgi:hypothetical protein